MNDIAGQYSCRSLMAAEAGDERQLIETTESSQNGGTGSRLYVMRLLGLSVGGGLVSTLESRRPLRCRPAVGARWRCNLPRGAVIRTVLKDISPDALAGGTTLCHERLSLTMPDGGTRTWRAACLRMVVCRRRHLFDSREATPRFGRHVSERRRPHVDEVNAAKRTVWSAS